MSDERNRKNEELGSKNFKLSGDILEKALRIKTPKKSVKSLHFIINYFDNLITEYTESLLKKFEKEELIKLKSYGDYAAYFARATPSLSPKKYINYALAKYSFEHELDRPNTIKLKDLKIKNIKGEEQSYDEVLASLSEDECLGLLILLLEN